MSDSSRLRPASSPVPLTQALRAAAVSVVVSWLPLALVAVVAWAASARTTVGWSAALGAASLAWVASHLASLREGSTLLSLSPTLLLLLPLSACVAGARTLVEPVEHDRTPRLAWLGGIRRGVAALIGTFVGAYALLGLVVALHAASMPVSPSWPSTVLWLVLVPLLGTLIGLRQELADPSFAPVWHDQVVGLVPTAVRRAVAPGLGGAGLLLATGLVPGIVTLALHLGRVRELTGALGAGAPGNVILAMIQLAWLPTAAAWGLSWLAGPGFSIGLGSTYTWWHARSGLLPMVPVLGALPDNGPLPWWTAFGAVLPLVVGAVTAHRAIGRLSTLSSLRAKAVAAATAWGAMLLGSLAILLAAGGSLGSRALVAVGPHLLATLGALALETAVGAALAWLLARRRFH